MELGGNIVLTGFSDRDFTELIVVKKMVGQYARKFSDHTQEFQRLSIVLKEVHGTKFEIISKAEVANQEFAAESTDHNLYVALDSSLKHVLAQIQKAHARN